MTTDTLEAQRAQVVAWLIEGKRPPEIAALTGTSRQAVHAFKRRHITEIQPRQQAIINARLRDKEARINELNWLYETARTEAETHGLTIVETRTETDGEGEEATKIVYETRDFRTGMVREMRGLLKDIADELGQIPRPDKGGDTINIQNAMLVRYVSRDDV